MIEGIVYVTRFLLVMSGMGVAVHYHLMANSMRRAPFWVKAIALPASTLGGVGMVFCGLAGAIFGAAIASAVAMSAVLTINLASRSTGVHVAVQFEKQAQARDLLKVKGLMREFREDVEDLRDIQTDSGLQELRDSQGSQGRSVEHQA